jgi:hypothetical protein
VQGILAQRNTKSIAQTVEKNIFRREEKEIPAIKRTVWTIPKNFPSGGSSRVG